MNYNVANHDAHDRKLGDIGTIDMHMLPRSMDTNGMHKLCHL